MKSLLKVFIILTGLYSLAHILFDLTFNTSITMATNIIQTLFFLFLFLYVSLYIKVKK
jgi:hypothetical protein